MLDPMVGSHTDCASLGILISCWLTGEAVFDIGEAIYVLEVT